MLQKFSKQKSILIVEANPLDSMGIKFDSLKIENLNDARAISKEELLSLLHILNSTEINEERIRILEDRKTPYLFTSEDLDKIINITPSVKTRLRMIGIIGPRLVDPLAKSQYFISKFRYSEEKSIVEDVLKARIQTINASQFKRSNISGKNRNSSIIGGRGFKKETRNEDQQSPSSYYHSDSSADFSYGHSNSHNYSSLLHLINEVNEEKAEDNETVEPIKEMSNENSIKKIEVNSSEVIKSNPDPPPFRNGMSILFDAPPPLPEQSNENHIAKPPRPPSSKLNSLLNAENTPEIETDDGSDHRFSIMELDISYHSSTSGGNYKPSTLNKQTEGVEDEANASEEFESDDDDEDSSDGSEYDSEDESEYLESEDQSLSKTTK